MARRNRREPRQSRREQKLGELLQLLQIQQAANAPEREQNQEQMRTALQLLGLVTGRENNQQQLALQREGLQGTQKFQEQNLGLDERRLQQQAGQDERRFGLDTQKLQQDQAQTAAMQEYQNQQLALQQAQMAQGGALAREGMQNQVLQNVINDPSVPVDQRLQMARPGLPQGSQDALQQFGQQQGATDAARLRPAVEQMYGQVAKGNMSYPQLQEQLQQIQTTPGNTEGFNALDWNSLNQGLTAPQQQQAPQQSQGAAAVAASQLPTIRINEQTPNWQIGTENFLRRTANTVPTLLDVFPFLGNVASQATTGQDAFSYYPKFSLLPYNK